MVNKTLTSFLRKALTLVVAAVIIMCCIFIPNNVQALGGFDLASEVVLVPINEYKQDIAPGVSEKRYSFDDVQSKKVECFVSDVDLGNPCVTIKAGIPINGNSKGLQTVGMQAVTADSDTGTVVAAVNADFFNMSTGIPINPVLKDGVEIVPGPGQDSWMRFFGITKDKKAVIGDGNLYYTIKDNLMDALGGNAMLVKDGQVYETPGASSDRGPRTAVGIKPDGNVFFVAIDGRQAPYSAGISTQELAKLMINLGADMALNLDGGGSTTFLSREPGKDGLKLVNSPSEGQERSVANSWLVVSTAEPDHIFNSAYIEPNSKSFTPRTTIQFTARGMDKSFSPAPIPSNGLTWELSDDGFGDIDNSGKFVSSGKAGEFQVLLKHYQDVVGSTWVEICNPDEIYFENSDITAARNSQMSTSLIARFNKRNVIWKPDDLEWNIIPNAGSIDNYGNINTYDALMNGKITARLKGAALTAEASLNVKQLPVVVADFENIDFINSWNSSTADRGEISSIGFSTIPEGKVKLGNNSLKVDYDFTGAQNQTTLGVYAGPGNKIELPENPTSIGMWVYADSEAQGYWLRTQLIDSENNIYMVNFTSSASGINWTGWKYIEAPIPQNYKAPLYIDTGAAVRIMSLSSGVAGPMTKGSLYVDNIRAVYGNNVDDTNPPVIESVNVDGRSFDNGLVEIRARLHENQKGTYRTGIDWEAVRIYVDGVDYAGDKEHFSYGEDGTVSLSGLIWPDGTHKVIVTARDHFGNNAVKTIYFTVNEDSAE